MLKVKLGIFLLGENFLESSHPIFLLSAPAAKVRKDRKSKSEKAFRIFAAKYAKI